MGCIDEVRDLREKVKLTPAKRKKTRFLLLMVHMLTGEANALLKTLEPAGEDHLHLATTEPHKFKPSQDANVLISEGLVRGNREYLMKLFLGRAISHCQSSPRWPREHKDALSYLEQCMIFGDGRKLERIMWI